MINWLVNTVTLMGIIIFFMGIFIGVFVLIEWVLPSSLIEKIKDYHNRH